MKLDKKQVPQLVVLGILVVAFVGFVSFQVTGPGSSKKSKPVQASQSASNSAKSDSDAAQETDAQAEVSSMGVFPDLAVLPARRDPFAPQALPNQVVEEANRPVTIRPAKRFNPIAVPSGRVPSLNISPINPFSQGNASTGLAAQPEPEKEEQFTLTGIVRGASNVAIIRSSTGRYVVREGQYIDGRYKVLAVTGDGAVLVYKNRHIPVKLGGDKNAN